MNLSIAFNFLFTVAVANAKIGSGSNASQDVVPADSDASADNFYELGRGGKLCTGGFIPCTNGIVSGSGSLGSEQTCAVACDRKCCNGVDACAGFTGSVCKDRKSCSGDGACKNARVLVVAQSCEGTQACEGAALTSRQMKASCNGNSQSCFGASDGGLADFPADFDPASFVIEENNINFENSCDEDRACEYALFATGDDALESCCNGNGACQQQTVNSDCSTEAGGAIPPAATPDTDEADLAGPGMDNAVKME